MTLLPPPEMVRPFDGMSSAGVLAAAGGPAALRWAVKSAGADAVCGLAIPFFGRDSYGEYFTPETAFGLVLGVPLLWEHGQDPQIKSTVLGEVSDAVKLDDEGLWVEVQMRKHHAYVERIKRLLAAGKLSFSSAALAGLWRKEEGGRVADWPLAEVSLTQTPANARATVYRP
ncbi:MAG: HK97 family phage prohead protease [Chloroflexi bacterium]|nr:HK97 family phage prohead protease [Chloroflexota bacterium]